MHYYSFNIGDYAKHARHLSNEEDLAYRRLLDLYYLEEKPLTLNTKKLSKLIGMRENQEDIEYVLETFFFAGDDGFHNKRADRDIAEYHAKADTARANGRKGGRPRKADSNPEETGLEPKKTQPVNLANPEETGSQANHKPLTNNQEPKDNYMSADANCPHESIISLYHRILPSNPKVKIWNDTRKASLRTRWREDSQRQNLEWWERFFGYISQSDFLTGRTEQQGRKPFLADLEWILKPTNFVKIIEGKYE